MYTFFAFIFIFGLIVFIHELGHFLAAKSVGVRVEKFYVGFNIFGLGLKKIYKGTEYGIGLLPLGGYCKMAGMVDESLDTIIEHKPDEFSSKNIFEKLWILSAGVIMNFLLAILLFFLVFYFKGILDSSPTVGEIIEGKPAYYAGIMPGAKIQKISDSDISSWDDIIKYFSNYSSGDSIEILYLYDDEIYSKSLTPVLSEDGSKFQIGIKPKLFREVGFSEAFIHSIKSPGKIIIVQLSGLSQLMAGELDRSDLGGPIRLTYAAGQIAEQLGLPYFLLFMAMISTILGFMNILPIPGLDGGHAFLTIIEGFYGRPLPIKLKMGIQQISILMILGLTVFIIYNDIQNINNPILPK